jgi:hypothetical protein
MAEADQGKAGRDSKQTETDFLAQEAERAKAAVTQAWADAKAKAMQGLDPRVWTASHPWYALTGAALTGFIAAYSLTPTKEQQILRKIARINRAIAGGDPDADVDGVSDTAAAAHTAEVGGRRVKVAEGSVGEDHPSRTSGMLGMIGRELVKAIGPSIMSSITAAIAAKTAAEDTNGRAPADTVGQPDAEDYSNPT